MLDVVDFIADRGGDPKKIRESQRLRNAPESAVDEVIALYEQHRRGVSTLPILSRDCADSLAQLAMQSHRLAHG